jgi:hypothetical protein
MTASKTETAFAALLANVSDDDAKKTAAFYVAQCDERLAFELAKNANNESIKKHVNNAAKKFATLRVARFMIAAEVRSTFINEQERVNARRNIYSVAKLLDLAENTVSDTSFNAINNACLSSLFKFEKAELEFTHADALASASRDVNVKDTNKRKFLTRHIVDANTASTQASSTMNALLAARVVDEYTNDNRETCYKLRDNALVTHLRARYMSA